MKRFGVGKPVLKGVKDTEIAGGIGAKPVVAAAAAAAVPAMAARSENAGARVRTARPAPAPSLAPIVPAAAPIVSGAYAVPIGAAAVPIGAAAVPIGAAAAVPIVSGAYAGPGAAAPAAPAPKLVISEMESKEKESKAPKAPKEPKPIAVGDGIIRAVPVPEGALTTDEWKAGTPDRDFVKKLAGPNPVQTVMFDKDKKPVPIPYTPITSPEFQDFIVQIYQQYSPFLTEILKESATTGKSVKEIKESRKTGPPKEVDRDACKRRNPENRELFYYQKIVRDYMSRGTPYRGLLLYHGLGSGKTCASIAAAEALYYGGLKTIYILTPATLSNNYRKDIGKCGFYPLRQNNHWQFLKTKAGSPMKIDLAYAWLTKLLGLPSEIVEKQGGGWVATPGKPSNWNTLTPDVQAAIRAQQAAHLEHRFKFIHYNGATPAALSALAEAGVESGKQMFDNAVVVIDEVHNLVRTINGTQIGGKPISKIMDNLAIEPRESTWSTPLARATKGYRYPRAYTLYRLLQNAVDAKIIALSATPMINYAQEMAILLNIIGGEQRMVEVPLAAKGAKVEELKTWMQQRPDVDFYRIETNSVGESVLNFTPVPFRFTKVIRGDFSTRGFVKVDDAGSVRSSRERNMETWSASVLADAQKAGLITATPEARIRVMPLLPDDATDFVDNFIDKVSLKIMNENTLKKRASGLISYYRGGSEELMPRVGLNEEVKVPMSEYMFKEYSRARLSEIENDGPTMPEPQEGKAFDLYAFTTKNKQTGFLSQSRAACNWVFPEEVPRPAMDGKQQAKLLGVEKERIVAVDMVEDADVDDDHQEAVDEKVAVADEAPAAAPTALDARLIEILGSLMTGLESHAEDYLNRSLATFSPKYAEIIARIRVSPGPALVYSQFKRLEGLGIFAAALRAADEKFIPLDIQKVGGEWTIPVELMDPRRPRYIMYTGDQDREKRRLLLQLYNADLAELPPKLAAQCRELLAPAGVAPATDNRDGRICRVFMITQSGAEGISLSNTRQVHVMEPYWNNVRIQQVIGRAIRLCSHQDLPWEARVVDIFTYLSVFSATQKAEGSKQLMTADKSMTTDQMIFEIATNKQKLADGLSEILQAAAVDCQIHFEEHGGEKQPDDPPKKPRAVKCFKYRKGARPLFMFHPDWRKDAAEAIRAATAGEGAP